MALPLSWVGWGMASVAAAAAASQTPAPQEPPTFPASVELVSVDVVVLDRDGVPVEGLEAGAFRLQDEGHDRPIVRFEAVRVRPEAPPAPATTLRAAEPSPAPEAEPTTERPPNVLTLVVDDIHLTPQGAHAVRGALGRFLTDPGAGWDAAEILTTADHEAWLARLPEGRDDLVAFLESVKGHLAVDHSAGAVTPYEAMRLHLYDDRQVLSTLLKRQFDMEQATHPFDVWGNVPEGFKDIKFGENLLRQKATAIYSEAKVGFDSTLALLVRVIRANAGRKGRKAVALVSEGFLDDRQDPAFRRVEEASQRCNAAVYFLDARGLGGGPWTQDTSIRAEADVRDLGAVLDDWRLESAGAESIALGTGGFTVRNVNDLAAGLARIARETATHYVLGFQPTAYDGRFHELHVEVVGDRGWTVRARNGYYATPPSAEASTLEAALASPAGYGAIGLRTAPFVLETLEDGRAAVSLVSELDASRITLHDRDGKRVGDVELAVSVTGRESHETRAGSSRVRVAMDPSATGDAAWARVVRRFVLAPGVYQARVGVRDASSGRIGTAVRRFEVPDTGGLRAATPILSSARYAPDPAHPERPLPIARDTFRRGEELVCFLQAYGAASPPSVFADISLADDHGDVLTHAAPRPMLGEPPALFLAIPLASFEPGSYAVVARLADQVSDQAVEVRAPFTVSGSEGSGLALQTQWSDYLHLIGAARAGDPDTAARLAAWPSRDVGRAVAHLARAPDSECGTRCREGALLLHADAALWEARRGRTRAAEEEIARAEEVFRRLAKVGSPETRDIERQWLLGRAERLRRGGAEASEVLRALEACVQRFPHDPLPHVARGAEYEALAAAARTRTELLEGAELETTALGRFQRRAAVDKLLDEAADEYRQALAADAGAARARLRLARLTLERGDAGAARADLEQVSRGPDADAAYVAHLLLGRLARTEGDNRTARSHYEAARDLEPEAATARLALAELLLSRGERGAAETLADAVLRNEAAEDEAPDPWTAFATGDPGLPSLADVVAHMRKAAVR